MSVPERSRAVTWSDAPFVVAAVASGVFLLYLGRSLTFWYDEWDFITFSGSAGDFLRPHNEHWSTLPLLLYRGTFRVAELHSYLPYLAELIVLHVGAVAGAYVLMRRRLGPFLATVLCLPLLLLGAGSENLFWAFQTGIVGSVLLGVWALVLLERSGRRSAWVASLLVLGSVMSSGIGLFFVVAAFGRTALDPELRSRTLTVVPAVLAYAVWHLSFGGEAVDSAGPSDLPAVLNFASRGIGHAAEVMFALEGLPVREGLGLLLVCVLFVVAAFSAFRGQQRTLAIACLLALVSMYVAIGLVRESLNLAHWDRSRYVYVAAFLLALTLSDLLSRHASAGAPSVRNKAIGFSILAGAAWALAANIDALERWQALHEHRAGLARAFIGLAVRPDAAPWVDPAARLENIPTVQELRVIVDRYGSPVEDRIVSSVPKTPSPTAREQAILAIVGERFRVGPASGSGSPIPIELAEARGVSVTSASRCIGLRDMEDDARVVLAVPPDTRLRVHATQPVFGAVGLGYRQYPARWLGMSLDGRFPADVVVPAGPGTWRIGLSFPGATGDVLVCALA